MTDQINGDLLRLTSLEAEQAALGAIMFGGSRTFEQFADFLSSEDFHDPIHQMIFMVMGELVLNGQEPTPTILHSHLKANDAYDRDLGQKYLSQCAAFVPAMSSAVSYAKHVADLARRREIYILGLEMTDRASKNLVDETVDMQASEIEDRVAGILAKSNRNTTVPVGDALMRWLDDLNERNDEPPGHLTGLDELDAKLGGFRPGKLYIVAGRPGMGKSTVLFHFARRLAENGGVGVVSAEMEASEIPVMMITDLMRDRGVRLEYREAEKGNISSDEWSTFTACSKEISDLPIIFDEQNSPTLGHIRRFVAKCKRHFDAKEIPMRAVCVDYLQIIQRNPKLRGVEAIKEITQGLIEIAKRYQVPIIAGCQLNRDTEKRDNKKPTVADLRESGDIENDAYAIILLFRPEYYHEQIEPAKSDLGKHEDWLIEQQRMRAEKPLEMIIGKNRRGPKGTVIVWCEIETGAIRHRSFNPFDPLGESLGGLNV